MPQTLYTVDAFTAARFAGNPAAVCVSAGPADPAWMQNVATELNLAETAFLVPRVGPSDAGFDLRWFTPTVEVDLCGHATLASAHVLWEAGHLGPDAAARFFTRSGLLTCSKRGDWIEMDFPAEPAGPCEAPPRLAEALGTTPAFVGRNRFDYLVELESERAVRGLGPDLRLLKTIPARGVIVTAIASLAAAGSANAAYDFVSRFFAPQSGVDEDPVTGSAHCCLAPFWAARLGKAELLGYQASRRGGLVRARCAGPRVLLSGQAVTVMRAELL